MTYDGRLDWKLQSNSSCRHLIIRLPVVDPETTTFVDSFIKDKHPSLLLAAHWEWPRTVSSSKVQGSYYDIVC